MPLETRELYEFGDFRLDAGRRLLTKLGQPLRITSKSFETLLTLVRNRDRVVSKDELMQTLWPNTFVEEVNLAQNISAMRKALGETPGENRYIATIPGKGYQFVGEVRAGGMGAEEAPGEIAFGAPGPELSGLADAPSVQSLAPTPSLRKESSSSSKGKRLLPLAVGAAILALASCGLWWLHHRDVATALAAPHSIAVLPFQPLVAGSDEEHLGLGMADGVITRLSNIHQLEVRPTDIVIRYGNPGLDPVKAARDLNVDAVVTGKLQKSGDRVRVTVQMIRVKDGQPIWAETFDNPYTGIFEVEDSISERVAQALALKLASGEKQQLQRHYTENLDAYQNYLMGRYEEFTFTREGLNKAIAYFDRAIADDPGYALAYAGLADAWTTESDWLLAPREALPKAEAAARKALAFDNRLAEAHGALAHALLHEWKLEEANREFHTALALNPSNASTYFAYAEYLASIGKEDEAIAEMQKALVIDPLSPEINSFIAWDYYLKRDFASCIGSARKAIQMFPSFWLPHISAGMCELLNADYPAAMGEFRRALTVNPDSTFSQAGVAICLAKSGRRAEALHALDELKAMKDRTYLSPAFVSLVYMALGDRDAEYAWLEKGYEDRAEWLLWLPIEPIYDGERNDPRFKEMVRKMGM
jgi:TolB-like protein/DNA-binding winged helix-turn-helix (wHTH) protein/Tfp pilus assembly protein PilF